MFKYWDKIIPIAISLIALYISVKNYLNQKYFSKKYSNKAYQVLLNSVDLVLFDIDLLLYKLHALEEFDFVQLNYQIKSLEENLELIKGISFENLPDADIINYQIYIKELNDIIYRLKSDINEMNSICEKENNNKLNVENIYIISASVLTVRDVLGKDRQYLYKRNNMFDTNYSGQLKALEQHAGEKLKIYGLDYRKVWYKKEKRIVLESEVLKEKRILDKLNLDSRNNVVNSQSNKAGFLFWRKL